MDARAATARSQDGAPWTTRGLIARHTRASLALSALIVVMLAAILVPLLESRGQAVVSDATTCSQWGWANQDQQAAYARLYRREHGPLQGGASVITTIDDGCNKAYSDDVADTVSVVQAITGDF